MEEQVIEGYENPDGSRKGNWSRVKQLNESADDLKREYRNEGWMLDDKAFDALVDKAIATAKALGEQAAIERIRVAALSTGTLNSEAFRWLNGILDEEARHARNP